MTSLHEPLWSQRREPFPSGSERLSLGRPAWRPHPPSNWAAPHDTGERDRETSFIALSYQASSDINQAPASALTYPCATVSVFSETYFFIITFFEGETHSSRKIFSGLKGHLCSQIASWWLKKGIQSVLLADDVYKALESLNICVLKLADQINY